MNLFMLHLKHYFKLDIRMGRLSFLFFNLLIVFLAMPFARFIIPESVLIEASLNPEFLSTYRPELMTRMLITAFVLLLLPAYIKRLKDINFPTIDLVLIFIFAPNIIDALLSDGGHALLGEFLMFINLAGFVFTVYLFLKEGNEGTNDHGTPEEDTFRNLKDD